MSETDEQALPQGAQLTALDEEFCKDPYPILHDVRQRAPVLDDVELRRLVYTRHDDVKAILRDKELFSDPRKANPGSFTREFLGAGLGENEEPSMLLMDEPGHRRLRSGPSYAGTKKCRQCGIGCKS
jgi:cytochrome P450